MCFIMNKEEILQKIKDLVQSGNFTEAKTFFEEHKEQLGPYKEKAQEFLQGVDFQGITDKLKNLFK